MIQDLRYGFRMLLKHPWFTFTVVLTLALGIGANTALFSIINALLLRPLPLPQPEQVVQVWEVSRQSGNLKFPVALPNMVDWRAQSISFAHIAAYSSTGLNLTADDQPEHISVLSVTTDYFKVIGVTPALGRDLREEDGLTNAPRTAVLSHGFWQRRFAADPQIVGRIIRLNSENCTIIGVMPRGFAFPNSRGRRSSGAWLSSHCQIETRCGVATSPDRDGRDCVAPRSRIPGHQQGCRHPARFASKGVGRS
jgi:putative ABC transport system permease protein